MPMPNATIAKALRLVFPNQTTQTSYTYYVAPTMPTYALGEDTTFRTTQSTSGPTYHYLAADFLALTTISGAKAAVDASLGAIDLVSGVTITESLSFSADIVAFGLSQQLYTPTRTIYGFAQNPGSVSNALEFDFVLLPAGQTEIDMPVSVMHELLHTVGLRDVDGTVYTETDENSARYTVMTSALHPGESRAATELQLYDIAALQSIYGRGTTFGVGDTDYTEFTQVGGFFDGSDRIFCIWDASGDDTIDAHERTNATLIDLRPGYFSSIGPGATVLLIGGETPALTSPGTLNISIAFGAYIENAIGSSVGDLIIGNLLSNKLEGGGGADVIYGEGSDSIHEAGDGTYDQVTNDVENESRSEEAPTGVIGFVTDKASQSDHLLGGTGGDYLHGGRGSDVIEGGDGDDYIIGGGGSDEIWGGARDSELTTTEGDDTVDYSSSPAPVRITVDGQGATASISVRDGLGGTDTLHSIETIVGTAGLDVFRFSGVLDTGYALTLDANGGQSQHDMLNLVAMGTGFELEVTETGGILTSKAGEGHAGGGTVTLIDFHTQILGSAFDDTIADSSTGRKTIDGGDGADVITVGGDARAMLRGGAGDDVLTGGDGGDVLIGGGGVNQLFGGDGTDMLISDGASYAEESDLLEGGDGSDLLVARGERSDVVLRGGAGNDLIRIEGSGTTIELAAGDGHDTREEGYGGAVRFTGFNLADATIYWDVTILSSSYSPGSLRWEYEGIGDLAIVVGGVSIVFRDVGGSFGTFVNHDLFVDPTFFTRFDLPDIYFEDDYLQNMDGYLNIPVVQGSVAQYDLADADYAAGVEDSIVDDVGTAGDDELSGGIGDDILAGGDGDDGFYASGGADAFDGGDGSDTLYLFGARLDYVVSRDAVTGDVTVEDQVGTEGAITVKSVEKIYFATDDEAFDPGELTGYYGTAGNDVIAGTARDNEIYGLAGDDDLSGGDGADLIDGGGDDDALSGGAGDDVLIGGAGDNSLDGGDGIDRANYSAAAGAVVVNLATGAATDNGLGGTDSLTGIENVTGSAFADTLTGDAGTNGLDGGEGTDALAGGDGDDTYFVDAADVVTEDADSGIDTIVTSLASYALGANVETLVYAGLGNFTGTGNALDNLIRGGEGDDDLSGGDGDDVFEASGGFDLIDGGSGADTIRFAGSLYYRSFSLDGAVATVVSEGTMQLTGVEYYYFELEGQSFTIDELILLSVSGTEGNDALLAGNWLNNRIYGLGGDDVLWGKEGNDILDGGDGDDVAYYSGSSDDFRIFRNEYGDLSVGDLPGPEGWDALIGIESLFFAGDNVTVDVIDVPMLGTSGNDSLTGSSRPDLLLGLDGDDSLDALGGSDSMHGGLGNDQYLLGAGEDYASDDGGDDAYFYEMGDGDDGIFDSAGTDYLAFGAGIAPEDVTVTVLEGETYLLTFAGASGSVALWGAVWEDYAIEEIRFDDETVWTAQDLHDLAFAPPAMSAFSGDDDLLLGRAGGDLFALNGQIDYGMHCQIA
jgi:Ca2+-binding RTX toxin-like protein